jgi:hypothetical protein
MSKWIEFEEFAEIVVAEIRWKFRFWRFEFVLMDLEDGVVA